MDKKLNQIMFDKVAYVQSMKLTCVLKCVVCSAGLQKMGPVGPGGFGQNIFGRTKVNFNSRQIGHKSQQIGRTVQQMGQTALKIGQNIAQLIILFFLMGNLSYIADGCINFE